MKTAQQLIGSKKWQLHAAFCLVVLLLLFVGMYLLEAAGFRFNDKASAFGDCFFFLFCIYTGRWLCQTWYSSKRLMLFALYTFFTIIGLAVLKWLIYKYIFNHPRAGFFELTRDVMPFFLIALVAGMLLKLIRASVQKELAEAHTHATQKESEFSLLQSQLSPHFLFNVLNNLYGISLAEDKRIPGLLLKLSQLLRYSIYGSKKTFIPLKEELEYIRSYIDFEQIRISDRLNLVTDIDPVIDPQLKIASLVLIVFVENAFKHSANSIVAEIYIAISVKIIDNFIHFSVANSYDEGTQTEDFLAESSGLGLANTMKRLELLYGKNHRLKQYTKNGRYIVELELKAKYD